MSRLIAFLITVIGLGGTAMAQPYTLAQLLQMATDRSQNLQALRTQLAAVDPLIDRAGALDNPVLDLGLGLKQSPSAAGLAYGIAYLQPLNPAGKAELIKQSLELDRSILKLKIKLAEAELTYETALASYHYDAAQKKYRYAASRMEWAELIKTYLRSRPFASPQQKIEVMLVENRLRAITSEAEALQMELGLDQVWLQGLVQEDNFKNVQLHGLNRFTGNQDPLISESDIPKIVHDIPSLRLAQVERDRQGVELAQSRISAEPQWSVGGGISQEMAGGTDTIIQSALQISLPVYRQQAAQVAHLIQLGKALDQDLERQRRQRQLELATLRIQWQSGLKQLAYYPIDIIHQHQDRLQTATDFFKKGQLDLISLLELEDQVSQAAFRALDVQGDLAQAYFKFCQLTAADVKP